MTEGLLYKKISEIHVDNESVNEAFEVLDEAKQEILFALASGNTPEETRVNTVEAFNKWFGGAEKEEATKK